MPTQTLCLPKPYAEPYDHPSPKPTSTRTPTPSPAQDRLDEGMARSIFESERQLADMAVPLLTSPSPSRRALTLTLTLTLSSNPNPNPNA